MKNKLNVSIASTIAVVLVGCAYLYGDVSWQEWFLGRIPYEEIRYSIFESSLLSRIFVYCLMMVSTYIFLSLVPSGNHRYTAIGGKTLVVYLLHLFIIRAFKETQIFDWIENTGNYLALFIIAFIIVYLLSRKWVWKVTAPILTMNKK